MRTKDTELTASADKTAAAAWRDSLPGRIESQLAHLRYLNRRAWLAPDHFQAQARKDYAHAADYLASLRRDTM